MLIETFKEAPEVRRNNLFDILKGYFRILHKDLQLREHFNISPIHSHRPSLQLSLKHCDLVTENKDIEFGPCWDKLV